MKLNRFKKSKMTRAAVAAFCGTASLVATTDVIAQAALDRVTVTGSAIRRVEAETALPIQVLSKQDIERTGATSTEELMNSISALSSSGGTNNSTGAGLSTYGLSSISLRGIGEERTLVLVNGRRLATFGNGTGAVNVNAIPLAAIERVEVFKDGASAIYGSDAIAGVINFILVKSFKGIELSATGGTPTTSGGGKTQRASITAGFGDAEARGFGGVVSASFEKETALFGKDRSYSKSATKLPFYSSGATGQGNIEGAIIPGAFPNDRVPVFGNSPGRGYGNPLAKSGECAKILMQLDPTTTNKGAPFCSFDTGPFVGLVPERELFNLTGSASFKLNPLVELFAEGLYSKSTVVQTYQPSPLRRSFMTTDNILLAAKVDPALIIYPTNPNYPTAYLNQMAALGGTVGAGFANLIGKPLAITSRVFDFGGRQQTDESEQSRVVVGAKGTVPGIYYGSHDYEVALSTNQSKLAGGVTAGYFSQLAYARVINDPLSNWNPWGDGGVQTGALADKLKSAIYVGPSLTGKTKVDSIDGRITGDMMKLPGGQADYAVGMQLRRESIVRTPSPASEGGDVAGFGGAVAPLDRNRTVKSLNAELNFPILNSLDVSGAARFDKYNDIGSATSWGVNARWQPTPGVLLRASMNTGFRAPTLGDLWLPQVLGSTEQFNDPATGQTDLQVNGVTGGNPNLKPERSKQKAAGFVIAPTKELSVGVDFFQAQIRDILATPTAQEVVSNFRAGDAGFASLVTLNGNDVDTIQTIISNAGTAKVAGVDVFGAWRRAMGDGNRIDVGLNGTLMTKFDQTSPGGVVYHKIGTLVDAAGNPVISSSGNLTGVVLRWKHALTFAWTSGGWTTAVTQRYSSRYEAGHDLNDERTFIPAQALYDLNVSYRGLLKNLTVSAGAKNVFNKQPATFVPVSNQFQSGYDVMQYDPRGRFIYATATYRFQ